MPPGTFFDPHDAIRASVSKDNVSKDNVSKEDNYTSPKSQNYNQNPIPSERRQSTRSKSKSKSPYVSATKNKPSQANPK